MLPSYFYLSKHSLSVQQKVTNMIILLGDVHLHGAKLQNKDEIWLK
jgi:hypothetical protein